MMRTRSFSKRSGGILLLLLWIVGPASAATPPRLVEGSVRIGFPNAGGKGQSRNGVWNPVRALLKAEEAVAADSYRLVVESTDGEAVPYEYSVPVPAMPAGSERALFAYTRPGSDGCTFTVKLRNADGKDIVASRRIQRNSNADSSEIIGIDKIFYVTIGSHLPALGASLKQPDSFVENVADLPDRWFGYEGVDVIVLTTGNEAFLAQLLEMDEDRRAALLDWVRRGGRLVLSVGRHVEKVASWLRHMPLVDATFQGKITQRTLPALQLWGVAEKQLKQPLRQIDIARVQPGPNTQALVWEDADAGDAENRPIVLQSSCGLGRVVLLAFDLDAPPCSTWEGQSTIWKRLSGEIAPRQAASSGPWGQGGELGMDLKRDLENFEEVPVISFGWVALFALFYIALIGPLDYLLLKKVFKRLELTWITFPILVLIVSAAAYATARAVKGDELRINKIDLVDIDLHGEGQVYGRTWFALFSPRVRNYTIALEPASPQWGGQWSAGDAETPQPVAMTAVLESPEVALGGNAQALFRRPYAYADDASGLTRLPIAVWATRAFASSWRVPLKATPDRPPLIASELRVSRTDENVLSGAITNNLPAELQKVALFFRGKWYVLGDLAPGEARDVNPLFEGNVKKRELSEWFDVRSEVLQPHSGSLASSQQRDWSSLSSAQTLRRLMFHDLPGGSSQPNSGLRSLDESWRLLPQGEGARRRYREEVLLVARTPPRSERTERGAQDGIAPSQLFLDERPVSSGYLQQETYVRIYIPLVHSP